jgi:hypothetical protein
MPADEAVTTSFIYSSRAACEGARAKYDVKGHGPTAVTSKCYPFRAPKAWGGIERPVR